MYKQVLDPATKAPTNVVLRLTDGCSIPFDEKNTDYLDYLAWLEQGNTPEPANS